MAVNQGDMIAIRFKLLREGFRRLPAGNLVRLTIAIAVEDRQDIGELVIDDEVEGFGDLAFTRLSVTNDAEDPLVEFIRTGGDSQARRYGKSLSQRSGGGIEKRKSFHGIWMPIEN